MDELIAAALDGAYETPPWGEFLERLRTGTGAHYASLIFRPPGPTRPTLMHLHAGIGSPEMVTRLYQEDVHRWDPLPYHAMAEGRAYGLDELLTAGEPIHDAFRRALLEPSGMERMRLMRVREPSGVDGWLNIARRGRDFAGHDGRLMEALAPMLRRGLRGFVALERERFAAAVAGEAIRRLNFGWVTLDAAGRVLDADVQGRLLLDEGGVLSRRADGRLGARDPALARDIAAAVEALAAAPRGRPRAVVLSREPWLDMLLVPAQRRATPDMAELAMVAYLHGDSWSSADRCEQLAELFELMPSEARLTLALARGMTIAEAATELGLTVETARNYSKRIYAKTGARGQADLVRFVHRSVLAIA